MAPVNRPAVNPCGSCPYRLDTPSGVWSEEEYAKLPPYDNETHAQPAKLFMCHQADGRLCAGWVGCHDMVESIAVRIGTLTGQIIEEDIDFIFDYKTTVELHESGQAAADHGNAALYDPPEEARKVIDKLHKKRGDVTYD